MLPQHETPTRVGTYVGLVVMMAAGLARGNGSIGFAPGLSLWLVGLCLLLWGSVHFMKGKGYSGWFGLFALLMGFGLIILLCFPDRHAMNSDRPAQ